MKYRKSTTYRDGPFIYFDRKQTAFLRRAVEYYINHMLAADLPETIEWKGLEFWL